MTIRAKILIILSTVAIVSAGISSLLGYRTARKALERQSFDKLTAVREMKASQVEDYFQQIVDQIVTFSRDRMTVDAMRAFSAEFSNLESQVGWDEQATEEAELELRLYYQEEFLPRLEQNLESPATLSSFWPNDRESRILQYQFIAANPFDTGSKSSLEEPAEKSAYSRAHKLYHPIFRDYLERFGFYDIFLVDLETGHIVYSVFKEVDFGTSLLSGPYRETNLARAFQAARQAAAQDFVLLVDFEPYHPSYGGQASFIASPIYDGPEKVGVLVFQMPVDRINDIMTSKHEWSRVGLGESGETYIVGSDYKIRNQSRFLIEDKENYLKLIASIGTPDSIIKAIANLDSSIGLQEVQTEGTRAALGGETGTKIFPDYRGVPVLSSFMPLDIRDVDWVIMSEIDEAEAFEPARTLRNRVLIWLAVLIGASVVAAMVFSKGLTRRLEALSETAAQLADGFLYVEVDTSGRDEIADLSKSFETMRKSLVELVEKQEAEIDALSTPLIPLLDDVVAMPLVGELDSKRIEKARQTLVEGLHARGAKAALLDLTGVPSLDTGSAEALLGAAKAAQLLGAKVVITGMRSEVAASVADLGLHLDGVATERSLQSGISFIMNEIGAAKMKNHLQAGEEEDE